MSLRSNLSAQNKFALICASLAVVVIAEGALLWNLSKNQPPVQVVSSASETPVPTATPQALLFTAPGVESPTSPAIVPSKNPPLVANNGGVLVTPATPPTSSALAAKPNPNSATAKLPEGTKEQAKAAFDRGSEALKNKDLNGARTAFEEVIGLAPDNVASRLNLALIYSELKQPEKSLAHIQRAAQLEPKNAAIQFNLAKVYLSLRKPDQALPALRRTVQLAPKELESRALLGQVLIEKKRPKDAYPQFVLLANANKNDIGAHLTAAAIANDVLRKPKEAEKLLRRAVSNNPREPQPAMMLAQLLATQKKPKEAVKILSTAVKARPDVYELYPALAEARSATGDAKGATDALQSALLRLPVGKTDKEKAGLKIAEGELRLALGRTLGNSKKPKEALGEFEKAAKLLPGAPEPTRLAAVAAVQLKQTDKAISLLQASLKADPKRDGDRRTLAQVYAGAKKYKESDAQWAIYTKNHPKDLEALLIWAEVAKLAKDKKRELEIAKTMTVVAPKDPFGWGQLAVMQKRNGDDDGALVSLQQLQKLKPNSPDAAYEVALIQGEKGNYKSAYTNWATVLENRPDYKPGYAPLLENADKAGQQTAARAFLVRILAKKPENLEAINEILKYYEKQKETDDAKAFLTDLVARDPKQQSAKTILSSFDKAKP